MRLSVYYSILTVICVCLCSVSLSQGGIDLSVIWDCDKFRFIQLFSDELLRHLTIETIKLCMILKNLELVLLENVSKE